MTPSEDLRLRPGGPDDLTAVADVLVAAREAAVPSMPPLTGGAEQARAHVLALDLAEPDRELWVAEAPHEEGHHAGADPVVGFVELRHDWLDGLYVRPECAGRGIGSALLELAMSLRPDGFCLWVFASNAPARAFYARRGLVDLEETDGSANMERSPDVRMAWPGRDPLAFLRGLVDQVDDGLGDLLARRVALTRQVQRHKRSAPRGALPARDPQRERAIARRLAERAPELGEERLARLVQVLIAESLEAVSGERPDAP